MQILIEHTQWHCNCHYINLSSEELISFNSFTTNSIIFVPSNYDFKLHFWLVPFLLSSESNELQEILETREKAKPHIWTFRTPEEANSHWKNLFGHLDEMEWWIYNFYNFINVTPVLQILSYWIRKIGILQLIDAYRECTSSSCWKSDSWSIA